MANLNASWGRDFITGDTGSRCDSNYDNEIDNTN